MNAINNHVVVQYLVRRAVVALARIDPDWFLVVLALFLPPAHRRPRPLAGRTDRADGEREGESARERRPQWEISSGMGELIKVVSEEEEEEDKEKEEARRHVRSGAAGGGRYLERLS